jgi:hypothetical protein
MYASIRKISCLSDEYWRNSLLRQSLAWLNSRDLPQQTLEESLVNLICFSTGCNVEQAHAVKGSSVLDAPFNCNVLHQCLAYSNWVPEHQRRSFHSAIVVLLTREREFASVMLSLIVKG